MQALRQIVDVQNHSLNLLLPPNFDAKKVEVIVLQMEEKPQTNTMSKYRGIISKETAEKLHQNVEQSFI